MVNRALALHFLCALFAPLASAQGLSVLPGHWETTSKVDVSVSRGAEDLETLFPSEEKSESCIPSSHMVLQPLDFAGPGCSVSDVAIAGDEMSFVLVCERRDTTFYGTMTATSDGTGTQTQSRMRLAGRQPGGGEVTIAATTQSHRTGPCL